MKQIYSILLCFYCLSVTAVELTTTIESKTTTLSTTLNPTDPDAFITTWRTTTANESITIPTTGGGYDYRVDWGDGSSSTNQTGNATHNYSVAGTYTVSITGVFPRIAFQFSDTANRLKISSIEQWGTNPWVNMQGAFLNCSNLIGNASDIPNFDHVTNLIAMFYGAIAFNQDIGDWDVSNVEQMGSIFFNASSFNQDLRNWDVSNVTDMYNMFYGASSFNQDLSSWDVTNVLSMRAMFRFASAFNGDVSSWDVTNVTNMIDMFRDASSFNQDLSSWNVSNVLDMRSMFQDAISFDQDLGSWNISRVIKMNDMFTGVTLSTENYDSLLNGWSSRPVTRLIRFSGGNSTYCDGQAGRDILTTGQNQWTITDGGKASNCPINYVWQADNTWAPQDPNDVITIRDNMTITGQEPASITQAIEVNNITLNANASLATTTNGLVKIAGSIVHNGTALNLDNIEYIGTSSQNFTGNTIETNQVTLTGSGTLTIDGTLIVNQLMNLQGTTVNVNGDLIFTSDENGTAELAPVTTGTINGEVTVERYHMDSRAYRMVSSAVTTKETIFDSWQEGGLSTSGYGTHITGPAGNSNGFDETLTGNYSLFQVDQASQSFVTVPNTNATTLRTDQPYLLYVRGDRASIDLTDNGASSATVLLATGALAIGTQAHSFDVAAAGDYIMFGNPYQSAVDMEEVLNNAGTSSDLNSSQIYIYDPQGAPGDGKGSYKLVDLFTGTTPTTDKFLQAGQAAQVQVNSPGTTVVSFEEDDKAVGMAKSSFRESGTNDYAFIKGSLFTTENFNLGNNAHDMFSIVMGDDFNNDIDSQDAGKVYNFGENMGIYYGDHRLALERRASVENGDIIPLFNLNYKHTNYTLILTLNELAPEGFQLQDSFTGKVIDLKTGDNPYVFEVSSNESKSENRFNLLFNKNTLSHGEVVSNTFLMYPNPVLGDELNISSGEFRGNKAQVEIHDVLGRLVDKQQLDFSNGIATVRNLNHLPSALYSITVKAENLTVTEKIIIK